MSAKKKKDADREAVDLIAHGMRLRARWPESDADREMRAHSQRHGRIRRPKECRKHLDAVVTYESLDDNCDEDDTEPLNEMACPYCLDERYIRLLSDTLHRIYVLAEETDGHDDDVRLGVIGEMIDNMPELASVSPAASELIRDDEKVVMELDEERAPRAADELLDDMEWVVGKLRERLSK